MKHVKHGKKLISLLLSAAVAMSMTLSTVMTPLAASSSVSDLRQKLQELQSEQEKVNQQLKDAQSNKADAEALKTQLEQQKALILSQISNLSEQIGSLDEEIVNKQDEIDQKQQEVDQKQAEYDQRWADSRSTASSATSRRPGCSSPTSTTTWPPRRCAARWPLTYTAPTSPAWW